MVRIIPLCDWGSVPSGFMEEMCTHYHRRHKYGHRCELEYECVRIPNVIANKSSEPFFNFIFEKRVFKIITRIHANPEENHEDAFLLLSTIMEHQWKTRLEATERGKSLQKNLELRLNKLKLRRIPDSEIKRGKWSSEKEIKDIIKSTFGYVQGNEEKEYISDHLFTMPFRTEDNSLQDCSSGMQCLIYKTLQVKTLLGLYLRYWKDSTKKLLFATRTPYLILWIVITTTMIEWSIFVWNGE